ncbi:unnamed protein product [Medioppia subpectinata]|uniref:Uncharacterized protein n=1 Tax=Medioppia subpectinata TaxID=1979941 RepID=A0A7R9Q936_9ACAR|nr:unnamed protein product [Medioppia subpectinata]CAG2116862.1 unnamed protein product [Medioppia subpectinata]
MESPIDWINYSMAIRTDGHDMKHWLFIISSLLLLTQIRTSGKGASNFRAIEKHGPALVSINIYVRSISSIDDVTMNRAVAIADTFTTNLNARFGQNILRQRLAKHINGVQNFVHRITGITPTDSVPPKSHIVFTIAVLVVETDDPILVTRQHRGQHIHVRHRVLGHGQHPVGQLFLVVQPIQGLIGGKHVPQSVG